MRYGKGWAALLIMALLSPLGILAVGGAWGEWDLDTLADRVGFKPEGMSKMERTGPEPPLPDYEVPGLADGGMRSVIGTIISAIIGAGLTATTVLIAGRLLGWSSRTDS